MEQLIADPRKFITTIEVVPPVGSDPGPLLDRLGSLSNVTFDGFSVATNPVAKPRMSAMALCHLIQQRLNRPAILHCTIRDHNKIAVQGELWGAKALELETVLVATGDTVSLADKGIVSHVGDVNVYDLITMAREAGLCTGVVLDTHPETNGLARQVKRLERKVTAGAQYAVTQPVYDEESVRILHDAVKDLGIPVILGILPLRTFKHAVFLHEKVAGIAVPKTVRDRMEKATDPVAEGVANAKEIYAMAKDLFKGACIMPPFDHFEVMGDIIG